MKEEKNTNTELMINLKKQVDAQIATLTTRIPKYSELNEEGRKIVDQYISEIDLYNSKTIDEFGKNETEKICKELNMLIGTMKTHDTSIGNMFTDLMMSINENSEPQEESFLDSFKKSPLTALKSLKNKPKKVVTSERYRRAQVLTNIDSIQEKLENIRNELRVNSGKLEIMAQNSAEQYINIQYQIVALQEVLKRLQEEKEKEAQVMEKTFYQIDKNIQSAGAEKRITRKIENSIGVSVNAATKAIMSRLLAQHNEELASDYEQDLSSLLPQLKGIIVTAEANDSLIQAVDIHNQFVNKMNEMLRTESERSKEAIKKVQDISKGSAIDVVTAKILTSDVLEVVASLKKAQDEGRPTNEAFTEILDDFRNKLVEELQRDNNNVSIEEDIRKKERLNDRSTQNDEEEYGDF